VLELLDALDDEALALPLLLEAVALDVLVAAPPPPPDVVGPPPLVEVVVKPMLPPVPLAPCGLPPRPVAPPPRPLLKNGHPTVRHDKESSPRNRERRILRCSDTMPPPVTSLDGGHAIDRARVRPHLVGSTPIR
jgi:hypothetical protein